MENKNYNPLNWPTEAPAYLSPEGWAHEKKLAREAVLEQLSGRSGGEQAPERLLWWGYRHVSGSVQAKRFSNDLDLSEAMESDFCEQIVMPFAASSREEALEYVSNQTSK